MTIMNGRSASTESDEEEADITIPTVVVEATEAVGVHDSVVATLRLSQLEEVSSPPLVQLEHQVAIAEEAVSDLELGEGEEIRAVRYSTAPPDVIAAAKAAARAQEEQDKQRPQHSKQASDPRRRRSTVVAQNISMSVVNDYDSEVFGGHSTRQLEFETRRAEFISVTFHKNTKEDDVGIVLEEDSPVIADITDGCLASDSPLRPGDAILSVNGKASDHGKMNSSQVQEILQTTVGSLYVVVHNLAEGAVGDWVESMVMKATPNETLGLGLRTDSQYGQPCTVVSSLRRGKKFYDSLLNKHDVVLAVNGQSCVHPLHTTESISKLIERSPIQITILARTKTNIGTVISEVGARHLVNSSVVVLTPPDISQRNHNMEQDEYERDTPGWCVCLGLVCFLVLVIGMFWGVGQIPEM